MALLGAYAGLAAVRWQTTVAVLAGLSVAGLGAALGARRAVGVPIAILIAGVAYSVSVASRDPAFDEASIAVAALLLVASELGFWSMELAPPVRFDPRILTRRAALVAVLGLGALGTAGTVAAAATADVERSLLLEGVGVAAAVAVLVALARLVRTR